MNNTDVINAINDIIEINNDRIVGYETAAKETENIDLKTVFNNNIITSRNCVLELQSEVTRLGGAVETGTKTTGKLHRLWMDFKSAITDHNNASILSSCVFGDNAALDTYTETLNKNLQNFDAFLQNKLTIQHDLIKKEYEEIQQLETLAKGSK
jgi:uncharacterized protein (TIGR02284 family)